MTECDYCGENITAVIAFPHPKTGDIKIMCNDCLLDMEESDQRAEGEPNGK